MYIPTYVGKPVALIRGFGKGRAGLTLHTYLPYLPTYLGKPVALIRGFGKGAQDFIAQPLQGLVRSVEELNPEEFMQVGR